MILGLRLARFLTALRRMAATIACITLALIVIGFNREATASLLHDSSIFAISQSSARNQVEGKVEEVTGKVERSVGQVTGQAKGAARQVKGQTKQAIGKTQSNLEKFQSNVQDTAEDIADRVEDMFGN